MPLSGEQRQLLLRIARQAIHAALSGERPKPAASHEALHRPAGCFVSLHEIASGRLRGCVGRLEAVEPLLLAVHGSALDVLEDPRFTEDPVTRAELHLLDLELTVVSNLLPARHCLDFEPLEHGICLRIGGETACFLPQVARRSGWGREQLLDCLCTEKLQVPAEAWRDAAAHLSTFTAEIVGPEPGVA
jgi:AmmeMemoRadiSam system protein A